MRTGSCSAHSWVSLLTPERPATMASQVDATSPPSGVVAPSPVTTTSITAPPARFAYSPLRLLDVRHGVTDGLEVLHLVVGDLHAELLLRRDDDLHHRQRVDIEILGERLPLGDVARVDAGDLF